MTKDIYEPLGEKLSVEAKRKPRAKRVVGKRKALAAPYGRPKYKAPGASPGFLGVMLDTASHGVIAHMEQYNTAYAQQHKEKMKRYMERFAEESAPITTGWTKAGVPRLAVRP